MVVVGMPKRGRARRRMRADAELGSFFVMDYEQMGRVVKTKPEAQLRMASYRHLTMVAAAIECGKKLGAQCVAKVGEYEDDRFAFIFTDDDVLVEMRLRYGA